MYVRPLPCGGKAEGRYEVDEDKTNGGGQESSDVIPREDCRRVECGERVWEKVMWKKNGSCLRVPWWDVQRCVV